MNSRDMAFDETTLLDPRPYEYYDNKAQVHGTIKKVKLEIKVPKQELEEIHETLYQ